MRRGTLILLILIILLAAGSSFVVFWPNTAWHGITNPYQVTEGLDLAGGIRVLLTPKTGTNPTADQMEETRKILEARINGPGVKEPSLRVLTTDGKPSISVELPYFSGNEQATVDTLLQTGDLKFWDTGPSGILSVGTGLTASDIATSYTSYNNKDSSGNYVPWFTGQKDLDPNSLSASVSQNGGNTYQINFSMKSGDSQTRFATYTGQHVGDAMTVTLDDKVITSATINSQITGSGDITGNFTQSDATALVSTLKYGALPVSLQKASETTVSPTLGQDAITRSEIAAAVGIGVVILFMLLYYRLPGFLADIALLLYATMTFAIFKFIGVTMTLAGIAGFILSIGMAVDANVLIFERVKEELRAGRILSAAIDIGWRRAWPSIRDSNSSTLITCAVLYAFGSNFGASIIIGFATTLFLGVVVSMFTAIVVTRTLLNLLVPTGVINHPALFGLPASAVPAAHLDLARRNSVA